MNLPLLSIQQLQAILSQFQLAKEITLRKGKYAGRRIPFWFMWLYIRLPSGRNGFRFAGLRKMYDLNEFWNAEFIPYLDPVKNCYISAHYKHFWPIRKPTQENPLKENEYRSQGTLSILKFEPIENEEYIIWQRISKTEWLALGTI